MFYEISCEASYPVSEGVTGGVMTLVNNLVGVAFLFIMLIKNIGTVESLLECLSMLTERIITWTAVKMFVFV